MCDRPHRNERAHSDGVRVVLDVLGESQISTDQHSLTPIAQRDPFVRGVSLRAALSNGLQEIV